MILETSRLQLREMKLEDFDDLHAVFSDPIAMEHYPKPFDREATVGWINWNIRNYSQHGFGLWAVILKSEDRLIGDCGLTIQQVDGVAELEIGYHTLRSHWGQGIATEAARECRDYAFNELKRDRVISWIRETNWASRRVAEKVGMQQEKTTTNEAREISVVYSMGPQ